MIGKGHWNRCKEIAKRSIADFYKEGETEFQPLMFIDVIGTVYFLFTFIINFIFYFILLFFSFSFFEKSVNFLNIFLLK